MTAKRQIIVGHANTFHDPAIAIIEDDKIFAEAIERHTQCKRGLEMPRLWYSWRDIGTALTDLDMKPVANAEVISLSSWDYEMASNQFGRENLQWDKRSSAYLPFSLLVSSIWMESAFESHMGWILRDHPPMIMDDPPVDGYRDVTWLESKTVNHHLSHAATGVYTSPFEECVVMVVDGQGEEQATSFYHFKNNEFKWLNKRTDPKGFDSLGFIYLLVTEFCGFNYVEGEDWKVMGLAAYGEFRQEIYDFFNRNVSVNGLNVKCPYPVPEVRGIFGKELEPIVGGFRTYDDPDVMKAADLAHTFQKWYEDTVIKLVNALDDLGLSKNLVCAGGCALNSSANGKILKNSNFERMHISSAPADDGNALGVALYEKYHERGEKRELKVMSPFLGSGVNKKNLDRILSFEGIKCRKITDNKTLCAEVAELIASGKIIGWMQGRAEFGPRALGNRSILADPRAPNMKDKINRRVKFREAYRPLAPSILHEYGDQYFEDYQESPYMERTLTFKKEIQAKVPAVVHKSGTGRVQSVTKEMNPLYYQLIEAFHHLTSVPMLLNTSFNVMGKPIIHSVDDAFVVFHTTGMDYLVIENYIFSK